ncbi:MAG: DUF4412 domain-containing protein, partial [Candidatus Krumholzibacteria bacterium]|nr:DUF4412 domain-containing protein [Candidatus Krumholzibacteria bacterium]
MKNIPAEQREMMKQMMGSDKAAEVKIVKKGAGDKVSGFKTTRYEVMADGELYEELWLADDKDLMKDCKALLKMMAKFSSCMEGISSMGAPSPKASVEYMKIFEQGMIVKSVEHSESPMGNHADVTEIAKKDVPDSAFDLPEGYKAAPLGAMWGMGAE